MPYLVSALQGSSTSANILQYTRKNLNLRMYEAIS